MRLYVILIATPCLAQVNTPAQMKRVLSAPESLAGRWETSDGHRGVVGMNVIITTHIQGAPNSIAGHPQYEDEFTVGVNRRMFPDAESSGLIFFSSVAGEGTAWDGHRLTIHLLKAYLPQVNIDLIWHEGSHTWARIRRQRQLSGVRCQVFRAWVSVVPAPTEPEIGESATI